MRLVVIVFPMAGISQLLLVITMTTTRRLNTPKQESERINVPVGVLAKARSTGFPNIPYIKISRSVRYDPVAVDAWLAKHSHNNVEI